MRKELKDFMIDLTKIAANVNQEYLDNYSRLVADKQEDIFVPRIFMTGGDRDCTSFNINSIERVFDSVRPVIHMNYIIQEKHTHHELFKLSLIKNQIIGDKFNYFTLIFERKSRSGEWDRYKNKYSSCVAQLYDGQYKTKIIDKAFSLSTKDMLVMYEYFSALQEDKNILELKKLFLANMSIFSNGRKEKYLRSGYGYNHGEYQHVFI